MSLDALPPLFLWVDGATVFAQQNHLLGWAYLLVHHDRELAREADTVLPQTIAPLRAPGAALLAAEKGLITSLAMGHRQVTICYDDLTLFFWITGVWISADPLIVHVRDFIKTHALDLSWYKLSPHSHLPFHIAVDRLAREAGETALLQTST